MRIVLSFGLSVLVLLGGLVPTSSIAVGWDEECAGQGCMVNEVVLAGCLPDGSCQVFTNSGRIYDAGGDPVGVSQCQGDGDGDGIDDACGCTELLTACCLPDGCLEATAPADCEAMGGMPFGACSPCWRIDCPVPGCIGATEPCNEPHGGSGCASPYCCSQICGQLPHCCEEPSCGDGVLDYIEECDDGNNVSGDGCEADCTLPTSIPALSGRGALVALLLLLTAATVILARRSRRAS